ncbi:hypothetical protein GCM10023336_44980 [Streptomyces similanensis]|uniref:Transposase n=1 Tax=Streptomyces similanensis TaxID=1274988 RepID=A0ABP9KVJ8_9ACTN
MALRRLGKDPEIPDGKSPTVYLDDETRRCPRTSGRTPWRALWKGALLTGPRRFLPRR